MKRLLVLALVALPFALRADTPALLHQLDALAHREGGAKIQVTGRV